MKISVIGAGYVGLVSAVCFADRGHEVIISTENPKKMEQIRQGVSPFYETGLQENLERVVQSRKLRATIGREEAIRDSDITFIAVGTPSRKDGSIDLKYIKEVSEKIGESLKNKMNYHLISVRSTVIPGTTQGIIKTTIEKNSRKIAGKNFGLTMQPEFLRQGSAIFDTLNPDRIIIGEYDPKSGETLMGFYKEFYREHLPPVLHMTLGSAEMIKYASNSFLATKISFINEIAKLCETVPGVDIVNVAEGMGLDKRIEKQFLNAGAGFGGSCFPKDLKAIIAFARRRNHHPNILSTVLKVNEEQAIHIVKLTKQAILQIRGKRISVLGLSFKPGTDDLREAPSVKIIRRLLREGAMVATYDPVAVENAKKILGSKVIYSDSVRSCLNGADAAIIVTEWSEFNKLTPSDFKNWMRHPIIIDARRIYDPSKFDKDYTAVGLGKQTENN